MEQVTIHTVEKDYLDMLEKIGSGQDINILLLEDLIDTVFPEKPEKTLLINLSVLIKCTHGINDLLKDPNLTQTKKDQLNILANRIELYITTNKVYRKTLNEQQQQEVPQGALHDHTYTKVGETTVGQHPSETTAPSASPQNLPLSEPTTKKKEDIEYFTQCGKEWGIYIPEDSICSSAEEAVARKKENSSAEFFVWRTDNGSGGQNYYFLAKEQGKVLATEQEKACKNPILLKACLMDWQEKATTAAIQVFMVRGMGKTIKHISPENVCYSEQDAMIKLKQNPSLKFCTWPLTHDRVGYAKNCLEKPQTLDGVSELESAIINEKVLEEEILFKSKFSEKKLEINLDIKNIFISREHAQENLWDPNFSFLVWREGDTYYCWEANKKDPQSFRDITQLGNFLKSANLLEKQKFADREYAEKLRESSEQNFFNANITYTTSGTACLSKEHASKKHKEVPQSEEDFFKSFFVWREANEQGEYTYYFWKKSLPEPESCSTPAEFKKLIENRTSDEAIIAERTTFIAERKTFFKGQINANAPLDMKNICLSREEARKRHEKSTSPTFLVWKEGNKYCFWRKGEKESKIIDCNTKDKFEALLTKEKKWRDDSKQKINKMTPPKNWKDLEARSKQLSSLDDELLTDYELDPPTIYRHTDMQMTKKTRINDANGKPTALSEIRDPYASNETPETYKILVLDYPGEDANTRGAFWATAKPGTYIFDLTEKKQTEQRGLTPYYPLSNELKKLYPNNDKTVSVKFSNRRDVELPQGMSECTYEVTDLQTQKQITRISYEVWPDHGRIEELSTLDVLVEKLDEVLKNPSAPPPMVHCKAGLGRTGTLVTAYFLKQRIKAGSIKKEKDLEKCICELILKLREQRGPNFVQKEEQFKLLVEYGKEMLLEQAKVQ